MMSREAPDGLAVVLRCSMCQGPNLTCFDDGDNLASVRCRDCGAAHTLKYTILTAGAVEP